MYLLFLPPLQLLRLETRGPKTFLPNGHLLDPLQQPPVDTTVGTTCFGGSNKGSSPEGTGFAESSLSEPSLLAEYRS